jgi:dTDP-4-amino-4,6-dideoxygalactose transaminase
VCEHASTEVLSLPMFPELTADQIAEVAHALGTRVGVTSQP